jgi:hypothetical protein
MNTNNSQANFMSDALIIALITATGYAVAFMFELGYSIYFGLPVQLIEINTASIIISSLIVFGSTFFLANFFFITISSLNITDSMGMRITITSLIFLSPIFLISFGLGWGEYGTPLIVSLALIAFYWTFPLISHFGKSGTYIEKVNSQDEIDKSALTITTLTFKFLGKTLFLFLILFLFLLFISYYRGMAFAKNEISFYVIESEPPLAVLRIYNNKLICSPLNKKTKTIKPKYSIISVKSQEMNQYIVLQQENVGPLNVERH